MCLIQRMDEIIEATPAIRYEEFVRKIDPGFLEAKEAEAIRKRDRDEKTINGISYQISALAIKMESGNYDRKEDLLDTLADLRVLTDEAFAVCGYKKERRKSYD